MLGGDSCATVAPGLPNIVGRSEGSYRVDEYSDGAFYFIKQSNSTLGGNALAMQIFGFDASRSNPIYGKATTVQPPSISLIPQIKF